MLKVAHLLKFLSELNPQTSPVKLALYNFLKAFYSPEDPLSDEIFDDFFSLVLDYPHWYSNKSHLSHEIHILLKNFNGFFQNKLDLKALRLPDSIQIFEVDANDDCEALLTSYLKENHKGAQIKIHQEQKKWLAFVLLDDNKLKVYQLDRKFIIRNGKLEPLRKNLTLEYDPELDLCLHKKMTLEISPHHIVQFQVKNDKISGIITRGYMFQHIQEFSDQKTHEVSRLFWPLKRIEQFFITRDSDPFYKDLVKKLSDITQGLWEKNSESWRNYMALLLSQSDSALENVYIGDNRLEELIKTVRQILTTEKSEKWQTAQQKNQKTIPKSHELGSINI